MDCQPVKETAPVSVLMPVHNGVRHLDAAIESMLRQDWPHFEFIIVDDGSTDGSGEKLGAWARKDKRIRVLHTPHQGIAIALNRGLETAAHAIVIRMDADDIACPERISRQVGFLDTHPEIVAVGCNIQSIDAEGRPVGPFRYPETPREARASLIAGNTPLCHPAVAFRRAEVLAAGGYRPKFNHAEDFDLWTRLIERHEIANLPEVLLLYRMHAGNVSKKKRWEQALAAHSARFSGRMRRQGFHDPLDDAQELTVEHLLKLPLSAEEREAVLLDLAQAALTSFRHNPLPRYVESAVACFMPVSHIPGEHARKIARDLARAHETLAKAPAQHAWPLAQRLRPL
ncbi:hypothetical protein LMIY3S_01527 [Labrys miyagiensis]